MSDYTLASNWSAKEAAAAAIDGDDLQTEFETAQTAINSKVESVPSPTDGNLTKTDGTGAVLDSGLKTAKTPQVDATVTFEKEVVFSAVVDNTSGGSKTIDWTAGNKQKYTLTSGGTLTFTAPSGPCSLILKITNSGASRAIVWPATVEWPDSSQPEESGTGKIDIYSFFYDGTNYWGGASLNY